MQGKVLEIVLGGYRGQPKQWQCCQDKKSNSTNCQHLIGKKINVTINRSP
jgi:hypothetical protein